MEKNVSSSQMKSSKKKGWLIGGVIAVVALVAAVTVFGVRGGLFTGSMFTPVQIQPMVFPNVYYVDSSKAWLDYNDFEHGSKEYPFRTLKEALDTIVQSGNHSGIIKVASGTYTGNLGVSGLNVTLTGNYNPDFSAQNGSSIFKGTLTFSDVSGELSEFVLDGINGGDYVLNLTNSAGNPTFAVQNNIIRNGTVNKAMIKADGNVVVKNNTFAFAKSLGSVLHVQNGVLVENNTFFNSVAGGAGFGVIAADLSRVQNNLIAKTQGKTTQILSNGTSMIYNNTIADNQYGGIALSVNGPGVAYNNLIANDKGNALEGFGNYNMQNNGIYLTDVATSYLQNGNSLCDPKFKDNRSARAEDYELGSDSTCVDKGKNVSTYVSKDYFGTARPQGSGYDIGFYESTQPIVFVPLNPGTLQIPNFQETSTPVCGNGTVETGEECDDANTVSGDGCSSTCEEEITPTTPADTSSGAACGEWSDISSSDAEYDQWMWLCNRGIVLGNGDGTLRPEDVLSRAELLALAFRASDYKNIYTVNDNAQNCFNDVNSQWFAKYFCTAKTKGFVEGYAGNIAGPAYDVILAEGLKMFLGALKQDYTVEQNSDCWYCTMVSSAAPKDFLPYTYNNNPKNIGPIELTRRKAFNMLYRILIYGEY